MWTCSSRAAGPDLSVPASRTRSPLHPDRHRHLPHLRGRHRRPDQGAGHHRERQGQPPQCLQRRGSLPRPQRHCERVPAEAGPAPRPRPHRQGAAPGGAAAGRACRRSHPRHPRRAEDFDTEFLDYILAVENSWTAWRNPIAHIAAHSTGHSEAILTRTDAHAALFTAAVDSAAVYVNCSTRFTDGGESALL